MLPVVHAHYIRCTPGSKEKGGTATASTHVAALTEAPPPKNNHVIPTFGMT